MFGRFFLIVALLLAGLSARAEDPAPEKALHVGMDLSMGASDIPGQRRVTDQMWDGPPSVTCMTWKKRGASARIAVGVGNATLKQPGMFPQPVEAWGRQELKNGSAITLGRFFAPFGQQEWEYEAKDGAMWEEKNLTVALQDRGRLYVRNSFAVATGATLGVSAARGRGFSFGSPYQVGMALDFQAERGLWKLRAESDRFSHPTGGVGRFRFDFAQLAYVAGKRIQPFLSRYDWRDSHADAALGSFRREIVGVNWSLRPGVSLETATAHAEGRQVAWAQLHFMQNW